jgi:hypothetical protein
MDDRTLFVHLLVISVFAETVYLVYFITQKRRNPIQLFHHVLLNHAFDVADAEVRDN